MVWPGYGQVLVRVWPGSGQGLARYGQVRVRSGQDLARIWPGSGQNLGLAKFGQNLGSRKRETTFRPFSGRFFRDFWPFLASDPRFLRDFGRFLTPKNRVGTFLQFLKFSGTLRQKAGSLRS